METCLSDVDAVSRLSNGSFMRIVVVEDHQSLRELFVDYLNGLGFEASGAAFGDALDEQSPASIDLLILDVNLPGENGYEIASRMRAAYPGIHILMLTARTTEQDRIHGYEAGADMYLPKPVSPAELGAAVLAVQRRRVQPLGEDALTLDATQMTLSSATGSVSLSAADVALLSALAAAPQRRLAYWQLLEITDRELSEQTKYQLELQVHRLRKKCADIGLPANFIRTLRLEGYGLSSPLRIVSPH